MLIRTVRPVCKLDNAAEMPVVLVSVLRVRGLLLNRGLLQQMPADPRADQRQRWNSVQAMQPLHRWVHQVHFKEQLPPVFTILN